MRLTAIRDREKWERHLTILRKRVTSLFRHPCDSIPIFVLGKQRSGTSMLMRTFHRHPGMLVYDEHRSNEAYVDYRIRSIEVIRMLTDQARFAGVCFKPICDSHRINELHSEFPDGHCIWIYRDYRDVANSSLRKFDEPTRAIRLICTGQPGGGWFQDGVSRLVSATLQEIYRPTLSDFDLACLTWWARNQIIIESGLIGQPNVTLLKYEALASEPAQILKWLFDRIGIQYKDRVGRYISARSIGRHKSPETDCDVKNLCDTLLVTLDNSFYSGS